MALAALIGVSLGAFGSGGSIVTLPVLVYVAGIPAHAAVEMSLAIVGGTSLLGAYLHFRQGRFHARAVLLFALAGGIGAYLGRGVALSRTMGIPGFPGGRRSRSSRRPDGKLRQPMGL